MKYIHNNKGSTLALAFITITILTILFLATTKVIFSNSLQVNNTETDIQSRSLSEMGVIHHRSLILSNFIDLLLDDDFLEIAEAEYLAQYGDSEEDDDFLKAEYVKIIIELITDELQDIPPYSKNLDPDNLFEITEHVVTHNEIDIFANYTSVGNNSIKNIPLDTEIKIPAMNIISSYIDWIPKDDPNNPGDGGGSDNEKEIFPEGSFVKEPMNLEPCTDNSLQNVECQHQGNLPLGNGQHTFKDSIIKVIGTLNINGNTNQNTNSTIWVSENLTTGNFNGANVNLHVGGTANFNSNFNNLNDSIIEIMGSATFSQNVQNVKKTIIFIRGTASFNSHLDLEDQSIAYIRGNTTISGNLDVSRDSKLCVNAHLIVNGQLRGNNNVYAVSSNRTTGVNTNPDAFKANCFVNGEEPNSAEMLIPILKFKVDELDWEDLFESEYNY